MPHLVVGGHIYVRSIAHSTHQRTSEKGPKLGVNSEGGGEVGGGGWWPLFGPNLTFFVESRTPYSDRYYSVLLVRKLNRRI